MVLLKIAYKMLIGDKAKYIGIILGLSFSSFIIIQQAAIFIGLMSRTFGFITDTSQPNIWVMDPKVQFIDDIKPIKDTALYKVRSVEGVSWAVPLYKGLIKARLKNGNFQICNVVGIDDATLIGGPPKMLKGKIENLRAPDAVIINKVGAEDKLSSTNNGTNAPFQVGDVIELNDHRAVAVGICEISRTFQSQPVVYTTYNRALSFAPRERKLLSFVLVHSKEGVDPKVLCRKISESTGLAAYTSEEFKWLTIQYYMTETGIPINFGVAVFLGFVIGAAIAGQTFYNFTLDNLPYFAAFKAMGAIYPLLRKLILFQALIVGTIGWGLGLFAACCFGIFSYKTELSFLLPWQLYLFSGLAMMLICFFGAWLSLWRLKRLDPAIVFSG